ncbi:MAG: L-rhamnose/proton symporter RhaT [Planctomycetota bacterium]
MDTGIVLGFTFIVLGAACGGSFGLPSKFVKKDTPWEVLWGPFFFITTVLMPAVVAPLIITDLGGIYASVGAKVLITVLVFGVLWGLGSMTLGLSFAFIGLSLAYALNYGAQIIFGWLMPTLLHHPGEMNTPHGRVILLGVVICVLGVVVAGKAGVLKARSLEKDKPAETPEATGGAKKPKALIGLMLAVGSGILCACWAVASSYAKPIGDEAAKANAQWAAAWAIVALILWGGAVSACLYCVIQLTRKKTWGHLAKPGIGKIVLLAAAMAVLHNAAVFFFVLGAINLGDLGVSVGYAAFMATAIIVGNVHGFRTGEWKGASSQSKRWIAAGIAVLIAGVCVLAVGKSMKQKKPDKTAAVRIEMEAGR